MYVIPVYDGNVQTVTTFQDDGPGSLRATVAAAQPGDTVEFSANLAGDTIALQSPILLDKPLYIVGPGADRLAISGNNTTRIFNIESAASGTSVTGLTLENGQANEGGALRDNGASITLQSDTLKHDQAVGGPGEDALGGAVLILGGSTKDRTVLIAQCQFLNDSAAGGAGTGDPSGTLNAGGAGEGGAVYVDAESSNGLSVLITATSFGNDAAVGGDGSTAVSGGDSSNGGGARGGALFFTDGSSADAVLHVVTSNFTGNSAAGGAGGTGAPASNPDLGTGGTGGAGGTAMGGAVYVEMASPSASAVRFLADKVVGDSAKGGRGGVGGSPGGSGGTSGLAAGGGLALVVEDQAGPTQFTLVQSSVVQNAALAGSGGVGASGDNGGRGGDGASASGGGLYLSSAGPGRADTWALTGDSIIGNRATSGDGGSGGAGAAAGTGGNGGNSGDSSGGGILRRLQGDPRPAA
jgi:hypothetical protein